MLRRKSGYSLGCWEITAPGDYEIVLDETHSSPTEPFIDIMTYNPDTGYLNHSITLHLRGRATSAVGQSTQASFIRCSGVANVNILGEGMAIDSFKTAVSMVNCYQSIIQGLFINQAFTSGIEHSGDNLTVRQNIIRSIGPPSDRPDFSFGIRSVSGVNQAIIDNVIDRCFHPTREAVGISLDGGTTRALISDNKLLNAAIAPPVSVGGGNVGGPGSYGIWLGHAQGAVEQIDVIGNVLRNWACCYAGADDVAGYIDNIELGFNEKTRLNSANWSGPDAS